MGSVQNKPAIYLGVDELKIDDELRFKIQTGPEFLNELRQGILSTNSEPIIKLYQSLFSEPPWNEVELKNESTEEVARIILSRFEEQLSSISSKIITLEAHTDLAGLATAQVMLRADAYRHLAKSMRDYLGSEVPLNHILNDIECADLFRGGGGPKVFVVDELGIAIKYRSSKSLLELVNRLAYELNLLSPETLEVFMWTHANGKMDQLAKAAGMKVLTILSGKHNEEEVTLVGYKFNNQTLANASVNRASFKRYLLLVATIKLIGGDPSLMKGFLTHLFKKIFKEQ